MYNTTQSILAHTRTGTPGLLGRLPGSETELERDRWLSVMVMDEPVRDVTVESAVARARIQPGDGAVVRWLPEPALSAEPVAPIPYEPRPRPARPLAQGYDLGLRLAMMQWLVGDHGRPERHRLPRPSLKLAPG